MNWTAWRLEQPWWLLGLVALALLLWRRRRRPNRPATLRHGELPPPTEMPSTPRLKARRAAAALRPLALALFILALAGPQAGRGKSELHGEGIDIALVLDISGSMRLTDDPKGRGSNRLEDAKEVMREFVKGRPTDPMSLVLFAGVPYTVCPATLDHALLDQFLAEVEIDQESQQTAIGMALATALNRLRDTDSPSKVVTLVTDGDNNAGQIDPLTAAELAKNLGVKVYTIGVGSPEGGYLIQKHPLFGTQTQRVDSTLNEPVLSKMAEMTGGKYFRAARRDGLAEVFKTIDQLEKKEYEIERYTLYDSYFHWAIAAGIALLLLESALAATVLRKLP